MEEQYLVEAENDYEKTEEQTEKLTDKTEKTGFDPHISITAMQCIICGIIILTFFVIKFCFNDLFKDISDWYTDNVKAETELEETFLKNGVGGPFEPIDSLNITNATEMCLPIYGTVTSDFGYRIDPFTGMPANHGGIDIAAPKGSRIFAVLDGVVEKSVTGQGDYGNYIVINHGGFYSLYGHCESLKKKAGENVFAGEVIATCGSTGRSTGPHLHFEIIISETRIDPKPFLDLKKING